MKLSNLKWIISLAVLQLLAMPFIVSCAPNIVAPPIKEDITPTKLTSQQAELKPNNAAENKTEVVVAHVKSNILFLHYDEFNESREIYKMDDDGTNVVNLTNNAADDAWPDWSPDKSKIIFERETDFGNTALYTMNADGSNVVKLTKDNSFYQFPTWSSDGTKIAFCKARTGGGGNNIVRYNIWIMNSDGTDMKQITYATGAETEVSPQWFPNNKRLAYLYTEGGFYYIGVIDVDTMNQSRINTQINLPSNKWDITSFDISPDGNKIAYSSDVIREISNKFREIYVIDINTNEVKQLTKNELNDDNPHWSSDGKNILFSRIKYYNNLNFDKCSDCGIYIMDADGSDAVKISNTTNGDIVARFR